MAAKFVARNAIFGLPKAFPGPTSLSVRPSRKVSRVCFASASKQDDGRNDPSSNLGDSRADKAYESSKESMKGYAETAKEKADEGARRASESAESASDTTKEYTEMAKDKAKEGKDKAKDYAETAREKAEEGKDKAAETAKTVTEKAKETASSAWGAVKDTGHKIKETVVGTSSDDDDDVSELRKTDQK